MDAPANNQSAVEVGRRVLGIEAEALINLSDSLDEAFDAAIDVLAAAQGRVIVAGMGKSGHVARKIAATFASTGTPAQFVHPSEASHGDLGMVTSKDVALVLSNSGETAELSDLIVHTRRAGIPLIAIASRPDSTLMRAADVGLILPPAPEACPMGLAPTTSTTTSLALGDALAVALMERKNFRPEHYRMLHPGGTLGAKLLTVEQVMHRGEDMPLVAEDAPMLDVLLTMSGKSFGLVGVRDATGRLIGVISDGDLRRNIDGLTERLAQDVMTPDPLTIRHSALLQEALEQMNRGPRRVTALFVHDDTESRPARPVGLIHIHDCLRAGLS